MSLAAQRRRAGAGALPVQRVLPGVRSSTPRPAWRTRLRLWSLLLACCLPALATAGEGRRFPTQASATAQLRIQGSTDIDVFAAVIVDYQRLYPNTEIVYEDRVARDLYDRALQPPRGAAIADLLISTSADLQVKLANDGHALEHRSPQADALPAWARWRHEVFAISYEPVVIVYNTRRLSPARVPRTRRALLALLREPTQPLRGRVGSYDVERSSAGYLFATQDAQLGSIAGALLAALGDNRVRLEERTGTLLDKVARGDLLLAYNVFGTYAQTRIDAGAPLAIVQPEDYTLVVPRTAVIPRRAAHAAEARRFLDYLLSPRGQRVLAREARLTPIVSAPAHTAPPFRPIALGPGLLVYLDALKREQFLEAWRSSVRQSPSD